MRSILQLSIVLILLPNVMDLEAQPELLLEGEIRPRFEFRHGFKSLLPAGEQPAAFVEQRSRLHAHFRHDGIQTRIVFQDVRIWGNHNQVYKSDPALTNVYEAWAMAALNERWQVKVGRQELDYDNTRILGNLDWAQQGRSHDALLLQYRHSEKDLRLHVGGAWNQSVVEPVHLSGTFYPYTGNYKTMQFAWLHRRYSEHNRFSLLLHNDGRQAADSTTQFRQTIGGIGQKRIETWTVGGEFYYQTGRDAQRRPVHAWLLNAFIEKEVSERLRLMIGVDWLTGTEPEDAASRNNSFDPLYGTNHKFYGYMDYFYVGNPHGQSGLNAGLIDLHARALYKTGPKTTLEAWVHELNVPVTARNAQGEAVTSTLGAEVDLVWIWRPRKEVVLHLGYSHMFATESLHLLKQVANPHQFQGWGWVMLTIRPGFLLKGAE